MTPANILIIDDEPSICWAFEKMLTQEGHRVMTASSAEDGLRLAAERRLQLVVLDIRLPGADGLSVLPRILQLTDHAPVIVITAFGDLETAVAAVKRGASDYLTKPFKLDDAMRACRTALATSGSQSARVTPTAIAAGHATLVGQSVAMQQVFRQIALVAESDLSVLITGETGTGKELVAAAIVRHSLRFDQPYFAVAPAALNPTMIDSELFGHVSGAFAGADQSRPGLFEQAEGGTILLDEIGDLPLAVQVKLLRILEQGELSRVGDIQIRESNVRILAATNSDLHASVRTGAFREDLFHRLTGMQIHLPPLRDRSEDIGPLCWHFLATIEYPSLESAISEELLSELQSRPWFGNVRELKHSIEHAAVVARGRALTIDDFPAPNPGRNDLAKSFEADMQTTVTDWVKRAIENLTPAAPDAEKPVELHADFLATVEPILFEACLRHTDGNRAKAAELLGIHRGTLRERLKIYGIDPKE